ncbi:hypothetical protein ANN_26253 [Periplaneta americana]|uniref:26S proteasome non-ATPase regulatory subunit 5 n=1 Tax=Periplaneta americana TaxID=6978 RepID=A0ABQ8S5R4_PERAM|nr:hypothetical protein ANN_26253 [Periplaneta americana]
MVGLCEGSNESPGFLKAISNLFCSVNVLCSTSDEPLSSQVTWLADQLVRDVNVEGPNGNELLTLQRAISDDSLMQRLYHQESLILSMITCVRHEDMSVANSAVTLLVKFGSSQLGLHVLYSDSVVACLKETMAERDVIRFRVYEVVVELSVHTEAGLQKGHISGLLPALIAELSGEDVLLQMNALELLTKLALCEHGLQYLQQQGVLNALANRATTINDDPLASLTLPGEVDIHLKKIRGRQVTKKLNIEKLKNEEEIRKFEASFQKKAVTFEFTPENSNEWWTHLKSCIQTTAKETIGYREGVRIKKL